MSPTSVITPTPIPSPTPPVNPLSTELNNQTTLLYLFALLAVIGLILFLTRKK